MAALGEFFVQLTTKYDDTGLKRMTTGLKNVALVGMTALGAVTTAFVGLVSKTLAYNDELYKLSKQTGISTESLSKWKYTAEQTESSLADFSMALKRLAVNMNLVRMGDEKASRAFKDLGVDVFDASGNLKKTDDVMLDISERFKGMTNDTEKTALAIELFGKSGNNLIPVLNLGKDVLKSYGVEAEKLGLVIKDKTSKRLDDFQDNLTKIKGALTGVAIEITTGFLPVIEEMANKVLNNIKNTKEWGFAIRTFVQTGLSFLNIFVQGIYLIGDTINDLLTGLNALRTIMFHSWADTKLAINGAIDSIIVNTTKFGLLIGDEMFKVYEATGAVVEKVKEIAPEIQKTVDKGITKIGSLKAAWNKFYDDSKVKGMEWGTIISGVFDNIGSTFKTLFMDMMEHTKTAAEAFGTFFDSIKAAFLDLIATIMAKEAVLILLKIIDTLVGGGTGEIVIAGRKLMGMASGGIVTSPQLVMAGEAGPEAIIPLNKISNFSTGGNVTININGAVDKDNIDLISKKIAQAVKDGRADGLSKQIYNRGGYLSNEGV